MAQVPGKKTNKKEGVRKKEQSLIYVGPNMGGDLPLTKFSVFKNRLPGHIEVEVKKDSNLARLFVPIEALVKTRAKLKDEHSLVSKASKAVYKQFVIKRGVKK